MSDKKPGEITIYNTANKIIFTPYYKVMEMWHGIYSYPDGPIFHTRQLGNISNWEEYVPFRKKVTRWLWVLQDSGGKGLYVSNEFYTDEEVTKLAYSIPPIKLEWSATEFKQLTNVEEILTTDSEIEKSTDTLRDKIEEHKETIRLLNCKILDYDRKERDLRREIDKLVGCEK